MEAFLPLLVVLVWVPVFLGVRRLLTNRRAPFAAGWALARWASGEPWRPPFLSILLGLVALAAAVWAARLGAPSLFLILGFPALVWFVAGVKGS